MDISYDLVELNCLRCKHKWIPRRTKVVVCPKCKSPYWSKAKGTPSEKLIVKLVTSKKEPPNAKEKLHATVVRKNIDCTMCDSSDTELHGFRWYCKKCKDYFGNA